MHSFSELIGLDAKTKETFSKELRTRLDKQRQTFEIREAEEEEKVLSELSTILTNLEKDDPAAGLPVPGVVLFMRRSGMPLWELIRVLRHYVAIWPQVHIAELSEEKLENFMLTYYSWIGNRDKQALATNIVYAGMDKAGAGEESSDMLHVSTKGMADIISLVHEEQRKYFKGITEFSNNPEWLEKVEKALNNSSAFFTKLLSPDNENFKEEAEAGILGSVDAVKDMPTPTLEVSQQKGTALQTLPVLCTWAQDQADVFRKSLSTGIGILKKLPDNIKITRSLINNVLLEMLEKGTSQQSSLLTVFGAVVSLLWMNRDRMFPDLIFAPIMEEGPFMSDDPQKDNAEMIKMLGYIFAATNLQTVLDAELNSNNMAFGYMGINYIAKSQMTPESLGSKILLMFFMTLKLLREVSVLPKIELKDLVA